MSDDVDYEIISRKDIARLKQEIKELKEGKNSGSANNVMGKLNQMLDLFKEASLSLKNEKPDGIKLEAIHDKLDNLLDQNQKIAEGLLSIADLVKGGKPEIQQRPMAPRPIPNQPMPRLGPRPPMPGPQPLPRAPQGPPIQGIPSFPKPGMPGMNPMRVPPPKGMPRPSKPVKKGLFRKK
ncbi:hypothetical protein CEE44_04380 [Candidatus Woesearchaeota archaeon B3_Woes]|nr:MAG: hypothetical protein CEE44_04380 [Candidatus Woesearchaeota archaeon B3_Woes]